ncbi:polysaccharide deacetylase family protein [Actinomadura sp. DC4]|uniref:polysaccharide deacetylase family protein n=1 Tax=Actinomadura sp. DC4 TaxID=3055069 RepID=UPI0025B23A98|nr:polysaccharide deacetylase family protein [Actinomadura sp. DC4]MDN3351425.1 polysaccharide deacetylase family protein [Actinomadura sp. DC4]
MRWRHLAGALLLVAVAGSADRAEIRTHAEARPPVRARPVPVARRRPAVAPHPHRLVFHGARGTGLVALTFDADMTHGMWRSLDAGRIKSSYDRRIVKVLDATRTPATIFATGLWIKRYPGVTRTLAADPLLEFGDHSYEHSAFAAPCYGLPVLPRGKRTADVRRAAAVLDGHVPGHTPYFRFPGGCHDASAVRAVLAAGVTPVQWDVISGDAFGHDPHAITRTVLREARGGSIVVMHLNGAPTAPETHAALPGIITGLRSRGLRLVKVSELLAAR